MWATLDSANNVIYILVYQIWYVIIAETSLIETFKDKIYINTSIWATLNMPLEGVNRDTRYCHLEWRYSLFKKSIFRYWAIKSRYSGLKIRYRYRKILPPIFRYSSPENAIFQVQMAILQNLKFRYSISDPPFQGPINWAIIINLLSQWYEF